MANYTEKLEVVSAVQWNVPKDYPGLEPVSTTAASKYRICPSCGQTFDKHGVYSITKPLGSVVCPGTWIVTYSDGRTLHLDDKTFQERYELVK
jgi:hypothetical protein